MTNPLPEGELAPHAPRLRSRSSLRLAFPDPSEIMDQDREWCVLEERGAWREIRFHDYAAIYDVPGLYERLFHHVLQCTSPTVVADCLNRALRQQELDPSGMRVLDLGAGNGMIGEELRALGVGAVVGVDILPEARAAASRDRPGIYEEYLVADFTVADPERRARLGLFDGLTCVAALGFGDIPVAAFAAAFSLVKPGGWVAFTIKETFMNALDPSGFDAFIKGLVSDKALSVHVQQRYRHRLSTSGEPLYYLAVVARKSQEPTASLRALPSTRAD